MELPHSNINRILFIAAGLWPYHRSNLVRLQSILFSGILSTFTIFQFTTLVTSECTLDHFVKISSSAFISIACTHLYNMFWIKGENMKYLFDLLQTIYKELKDQNEIAIMKKFGSKSERWTTRLARVLVIGCSIIFIVLFSQISLGILIRRTNESQSIQLPIMTEYFLDSEKYFYLVFLHMNFALIIEFITILSVILGYRMYLQYTCGMFEIVSYRLKQAMAINLLRNMNPEIENIIAKGISHAVDIHCKAMMFSELLICKFEETFFIAIVIVVICMSLNLFQIFQFVSSKNNIQEFLFHFATVHALFLATFLTTYTGQETSDHSNHVYVTAYNVRWYKAPLRIQKLILFLLQRSEKTLYLYVGGFFAMSLQTFATLMNTSISYFVVLYSLQ